MAKTGPKTINLTGEKFGKLTVIRQVIYTEGKRKGKTYWFCQCNCGKTTIVLGSNLKGGTTKSCGCNKRINFIKTFPKRPVLIVNFKTGEIR